MLQLLASLFVSAPATTAPSVQIQRPSEPLCVDVTAAARDFRAWSGQRVVVTNDAWSRLVAWDDADSQRMDVDLDPELRLSALLAAGVQAAREINAGAPSALFLAEYSDREKRGNPRRARVRAMVDQNDPERVVIDLA